MSDDSERTGATSTIDIPGSEAGWEKLRAAIELNLPHNGMLYYDSSAQVLRFTEIPEADQHFNMSNGQERLSASVLITAHMIEKFKAGACVGQTEEQIGMPDSFSPDINNIVVAAIESAAPFVQR